MRCFFLLLICLSLPFTAQATEVTVQVFDTGGKPVCDAVITALPRDGRPLSLNPAVVVDLQQVNKEFIPHVTVIPRGGKVRFPNRDSVAHHVFSFSEAKKFELPLYSGVPDPVTFDRSGIVTLGCNIHDWMKGYIAVVDTPYFGKSGTDGSVRLASLPEGEWIIHCWHPRLRGNEPEQSVVSMDSGTRSLEFRLPLRREWKRPRGPVGGVGGY